MDAPHPDAIPCLWFFVPVPDPLPLPSGWRAGAVTSPADILRSDGHVSGLDCSLQVHQVPRSTRPLAEVILDVTQAAALTVAKSEAARAGEEFQPPAPTEPRPELDALDATLTVIEAAVPVPSHRAGLTLDEGLDVALATIRHVQASIGQLLQRPVRVVTRQTLPPLLPVYRGWLVPESLPVFTEPVPFQVTDHGPGDSYGLAAPILGPADLDRLGRVLQSVAAGHPFNVYADLRREAMVQRTYYGNARLIVTTLATAGEVLVDTLLLHLLWEEGSEPRRAATLVRRGVPLRNRLSTHVGNRLGGDWDRDGDGPTGRYFRDVVEVRNRVVHTGLDPSSEQTTRAWEALFRFEQFVGDRLATADSLESYPRTAYHWLAEPGLRRRGQWTATFERFVGDERQPNWIGAFARWRRDVERLLHPAPQKPGTDPSHLDLVGEVHADGTERWVLHDRVAGFAAAVNGPVLTTPAQRASLQAAASVFAGTAPPPIRSLVAFDPSALPLDLDWRPEAELFPDLSTGPGPPYPSPSAA